MTVKRIASYIRQLDDPQQGLYARTTYQKWNEIKCFVKTMEHAEESATRAAATAAAIPPGYKLMPEVPTEAMLIAGKHTLECAADVFEKEQARRVYLSMLRAAKE